MGRGAEPGHVRVLEEIPARERIRGRLRELWNYERYGVPSRQGPRYICSRNEGQQNQAVIYKADRLDADPEVLLDPNLLSERGTVAVTGAAFTLDGRYMAYALSSAGSDWMEWRVRDVATSADLPDHIKWAMFSGASWLPDGSGFFYSRCDAPKEGEAYQGVNRDQKVILHRLGTTQEQDELIYARPDQPDWGFNADVTEDGRFLLIIQWEGTERKNRIFIKDLSQPQSTISPGRAIPRRSSRQPTTTTGSSPRTATSTSPRCRTRRPARRPSERASRRKRGMVQARARRRSSRNVPTCGRFSRTF